MSAHLFFLPVVIGAAVALLAWFYRLASTGRHVTILCVIVGLIVVETALYETIDVPHGLFHLASGSFQIRTIDVVIILALLANIAAGRSERTLTTTALLRRGGCGGGRIVREERRGLDRSMPDELLLLRRAIERDGRAAAAVHDLCDFIEVSHTHEFLVLHRFVALALGSEFP